MDQLTDQQLTAARARQADAAREDLARTAAADQALLADDAGPDWRAVEHAEHKLAFIDVTAMCAVQDLDKQNDARGREIQRLRAQLANLSTAAERVHTVLHDLLVTGDTPGARSRAAWTALDTALIATRTTQES